MSETYAPVLVGLSVNPASPDSLLLRLLGRAEPKLQINVARRRNLSAHLIHEILRHRNIDVKLAFAENPNVDPAQRSQLLGDPSWQVHLALSTGTWAWKEQAETLPDWAWEKLLNHHRRIVQHQTALSPKVPARIRLRLADHQDPVLRAAACEAWPELSTATQQRLLQDADAQVREAAEVKACVEDPDITARLIARLEPGESLYTVLITGQLTPALADQLIARGDHVRAIALNPSLPANLIHTLAHHDDPEVRLRISARPELTEEERSEIPYTIAPEDRLPTLAWVHESSTKAAVLEHCATSAHPWLRRSAATCPALPAHLVTALARDSDFAVRLLLCESQPEPPSELLLDLYLDARHRAALTLVSHPRFPTIGLADRFGDSSNPALRLLALRDPDLSEQLLDSLTRDPAVWDHAARDPRLPLRRVKELLADPRTAGAAAANPSLPASLMHELLDCAGIS